VHFAFNYDIEPHKVVLTLKDVGVHVGNSQTGKQLFENFSFEVLNGEKIAIVGRNGVGKSSLIKAIMQRQSFSGAIRFGGNVKVAYFDQELSDLNLNDTVIEAVHRKFPNKTDFEIRSALARLLIEDEAVFKRVRDLSGANRAKVQFLIIMLTHANVLILDEPTNQLDYIAKEALDRALQDFTGTLITVSHDRYFLNCVPTKIIEMFPDSLEIYNGNYDYYLEHRRLPEANKNAGKAESEQAKAYTESKLNKALERKKRARISALEKEIETLEKEIASLKERSAGDEVVSDYQKLSEILSQIEEKEKALAEKETEWLEISE
jgi:ATP-binding cassette subfamily F protein 3